jgi:hypothetical protein
MKTTVDLLSLIFVKAEFVSKSGLDYIIRKFSGNLDDLMAEFYEFLCVPSVERIKTVVSDDYVLAVFQAALLDPGTGIAGKPDLTIPPPALTAQIFSKFCATNVAWILATPRNANCPSTFGHFDGGQRAEIRQLTRVCTQMSLVSS